MFVQPVSSLVHLHPVQLDAEIDVLGGLYEVVVESGQPPLIVPLVELIKLVQCREVRARRRPHDQHGFLLFDPLNRPVSVGLEFEVPSRQRVHA